MKKLSAIFIIVVLLAMVFVNESVSAGIIPTISIQGVTKDEIVTVVTHDFPANKEFVARMGLIGTKGVNGILVGKVDSKTGGSLKFSFNIPAALHSQGSISIRLDSTSGGYYSYNWFTNTNFGTHTGGTSAGDVPLTPSLTVVSAKKDTNVTVKGVDFPADETFDVLIGKYGTNGVGGVVVDSIIAGEDTTFTETFDIPASLHGEAKLVIRFESEDSDLVSFTCFENITGACGGSTTGDSDGYSGIPTISILSVKADEEVTVQTYNFPKTKEFKVLMGKYGTKGVGGVLVDSFNSGDGGKFTKAFVIPESLKGNYRIAIRLQTPDGYYYAYNWFYNNTTNSGTGAPSGYSGIPTFSITGVEEDKTVTIKTNNFPKNINFKVLMGKYGTKGVGGYHVTTINSGEGGAFSKTFDIPAELKGLYQVSIRFDATSGGFYAYNWFYNNTTSGTGKPSGYTGIPTFTITGVKKDATVTIKTNNFPADVDFRVLMGKYGTKGVNGVLVTNINSGEGGAFTSTFDVPASLAGQSQIAIRLEATSGGFYAFNWFYNVTYP